MPSRRNNLLAGSFVIVSIILGVAVIIVLSDIPEKLTPMNRYTVRFSLSDGAEGLDAGSPVKVGGRPAGRVTGWEFQTDPRTGAPIGIDVHVKIRADVKLYGDTLAMLVVPLLGTASSINIPMVGSGPVLVQGEIIPGAVAPPSFLAQAGYGPEQAGQLRTIFSNAQAVSERLRRLSDRVEEEFDPAMDDARAAVRDVREMTAGARASFDVWRRRVDSTLANVDEASARFGPVVDDTHAGVNEARAVIRDVHATVTDNRPRVDAALGNVEQLTHKANTEGWESVRGLLERARQGLDEFAEAGQRVNLVIKEQSPELRAMIANARLASDQLKLTASEVRAAPWKLLSPATGRKELENEALYDAARTYSMAVSDLRAAAASLEAVATDDAPGSPRAQALGQEQVRELVAEVEKSFEQYRRAEQSFLERLTRQR
ncbi:MAG TPA: MlaD family protein [Phycisphaerales bacterium]|nr:MlaD family protein [Phycisphaerales bacterium]